MVRSAVMVCALTFALAGAAAAQGSHGIFLDGRVLASIDQRSHLTATPPDAITTSDLSATVFGGGFGVGTLISPRVSARVDATWVGSTTGTQTTNSTIITTRSDAEIHSQSFSVLAGFHPSTSGRLQPGYLAGVVFNRNVEKTSSTTTSTIGLPPFISSAVTASVEEAVLYDAAIQVGFELGIRLGSHLLVVPEVRASGSGGLLSIRPGVAVRWEP